ncbi:MAG: hypothetical protein AB9M53_00740 [Leptothrix sp. (in: b-proteobacteria)]
MTDTTNPFADVRAKFQLKHMLMAAVFMGRHDIRYYLNGIRIERAPQGGIFIVSTNGHSMCVVRDPNGALEGERNGITVRVDHQTLAAARRPRKGMERFAFVEGRRLSIAAEFGMAETDLEYHVQPGNCQIEGWKIDWMRVLPDFTKLVRGCNFAFNSAYIEQAHQVAKIASRKSFTGIRLWQRESETPTHGSFVVEFPMCPEVVALIMPMRDDPNQIPMVWEAITSARAILKPLAPLPGQQPSDAAPAA